MDDKQGVPVIVYLDPKEMEVVLNEKKHYGLSNKNIAIRKIIRREGGLQDIKFRGYKGD